jgi:PAS domain S-box-containing protein
LRSGDGSILTTIQSNVSNFEVAEEPSRFWSSRRNHQVRPVSLFIMQFCAVSAALIGLIALVGWKLQFEPLISLLPGKLPVAPNTALGFLVAGIGLILFRYKYLRMGCAFAVLLLGLLSLIERVTVIDFGLVRLLFEEFLEAGEFRPGQMALNTASGFILIGVALFGQATHHVGLRRINDTFSVFAGTMGLIALIGYSYGTEELYSVAGFGGIALHSAIAFVFLSIGLLYSRSDGFAGALFGIGPGARMARRLLPLSIGAPFVIGWIVLLAERTGALNLEQVTSVFCASMVIVMAAIVVWNAQNLEVSAVSLSQAQRHAFHLAALVNSSDDAIISENLQGIVTSWNAGAERSFGYTASEILAKPTLMLFPENMRADEAARLVFVNHGRKVPNFETTLLRKDGSVLEALVTFSTIRDKDGKIVGASKVMHDISERRKLEKQLLYSEQLYRIGFDQSPAGIVYLGLDGHFKKVNQRLCEITGYSADELLQMTVSDLTLPDDVAHDTERLKLFLKRGTGSFTNEMRYVRKGGEIRWGQVTACMVTDPEGNSIHSVGIIQDIQARITSDQLLRGNEERYRALAEASATVVWQTTPDGAVIFTGNTWNEITDQTDEEKEGWGWLDAIHPDDRARTIALWKQSLETCTLHENEFRVRMGTGEYRWFSVRGVPILNSDGSAREWVGANTDIHDEKMAAQDLIRLASLVASTDDALFGQDEKGMITSWNHGAQKIFGYSADEIVGSSIMRLIPTSAHAIEREVQRRIVAGEHVGNFESTRRAKDGRQFPASITISPLKDNTGKVVGASKVLRDITDRKRVEDVLRESEGRLSGILRQTPAGIVQIDATGRMTLVNRRWCEMIGYSEAELLGKNTIEITHTSSVAATNELIRSLREGADNAQIEKLYVRKDGSVLNAQSNVSAMRSRDGEFLGLIAVIMDISERKQFELELQNAKDGAERANLAKSDFLSNMSHELRSPLNAILGFAQLIESSSPPPTVSQKRGVDQILKAGWFLLELINEILDLAQIEAGKLPIFMEPLSVDKIVGECMDMVEAQAQSRNISVAMLNCSDVNFVLADRTRLRQVLINLMTNAIKYNRDGGTVIVDCQPTTKGRVRLSIKDSGEGLTPDELTQLFQRFNRLGKEASSEEGTGIGLVMSKRLVELMNGEIGVESTPGAGSVFWVELALTNDSQGALALDQVAAFAPPTLAPPKPVRTVLYVEDNAANLMLISECLARRSDIRMIESPDGRTGVATALAWQPDVILMDINLPGMSGMEAMGILSRDLATAHIPVIALSANAMPQDIKSYLDAGFFRYLAKPLNIQEFLNTLDLALEFSNSVRKNSDLSHRE